MNWLPLTAISVLVSVRSATAAYRLITVEPLELWRHCSEEICNHGISLLIVTTCSL